MNVDALPKGSGSGFVWDDAGHIVTNFHVVGQGNALQVTLHNQTTWPALLVGGAPEMDLAVLKVDAPEKALQPIPVGMSASLQVSSKSR